MFSSGCREPEWCILFDWSLSVTCDSRVDSLSGKGLDLVNLIGLSNQTKFSQGF